MENYFVIRNSDGDTHVECISKETFLERVTENYYGNISYLEDMPSDSDTNYWGTDVLVIKGKVVFPKEEKVVTQYSID